MRKIAAVLTLSALFGAAMADSAAAANVQCGDVITESITLQSDLGPCPGDGLVVGADGVRIDLGGHVIRGSGGGAGPVLYADTKDGVAVDEHNDVSVSNGEITNFDVGLNFYEATGPRVTGVEAHHDRVGVLLLEASQGSITRSNLHHDGYAIYLYEDSDSNLITDNAMTDSTFGVYLDKSSENTIWRNEMRGNLIYGMEVAIASDRNSIRFNSIVYSVSEGVLISGSHGNRFTDNVVRDTFLNGPVIIGASPGTVFARNVIVNSSAGDKTRPGLWINNGSNDAIVSRNEISGQPIGIEVRNSRVLISRNAVSDNSGDGIAVITGPGTIIDRNVSDLNGDDGIDVDDAAVSVSRNRADSNGDLGIESLPGTDAGGNRASRNGNPVQCTGVVCK